ncbi:MAG TPA: DUF4861 family protein [Hanamia sp.]|nr:DUF4861 family protein [Hanamia sp.]
MLINFLYRFPKNCLSIPVMFYTGVLFLFGTPFLVTAQTKTGWYTEGKDYAPSKRIKFTVSNPLNTFIKDCPIVIHRNQLPVQNVPERWVSIVDPALPSDPEPTFEQMKAMSGYVRRKETYGHYIELQLDDLDKDGIWDEIFFMTDLAAKETREFYIYIDHYERGMYEHRVHGSIANYGRHTVPLWESKDMGWKLWYPHEVDLHGKRDPMLTAYYEYSNNKSGYYMPFELGTDIMTVANTFGCGGMCLFENPGDWEKPARAYYSPYKNLGPVKDTRFAFDLVYNGPLRSRIKVTTTNWNSGNGFYELEQYYTAYASKSWSLVETKFNKFFPPNSNVMFGAGLRRIMNEYTSVNKKGIAISMGKDIEARIPDEDIGDEVLIVPWQGIGMVIRDKFKPEYKAIKNYGGNHLFKMPLTNDLTYEYMIVAGWSFGEVNNNEKDFVKYVDEEALKYNNPPVIHILKYEIKDKKL